jgi:hypothetical protein
MRIVHINSSFRENIAGSSHSDFTVRLKYPIRDEIYVVLLRASIPKMWYLINSDNYFTLVEGGQTVNISLPIGNYGVSSFRDAVQTLLTQNSPNNYIYTIQANTRGANSAVDTGKYIYSVSAIPHNTPQPSLVIYDTLYEQFGFERNTTYTFSGNTLVVPNVFSMNLENTVFVHSDICKRIDDNVL